MYRCVALSCRRANVDPSEPGAAGSLARAIRIEFQTSGESQLVFLNGDDVTGAIRTDEISRLASVVASIPAVRKAMVSLQREMGSSRRVVMEGRDIGTVVFPDAKVKVFLTASLSERARRRGGDSARGEGAPADEAQIEQQIQERDERDSSRAVSPLRPAADAVQLNTDGLSVEEVVEKISGLLPTDVRDGSEGSEDE